MKAPLTSFVLTALLCTPVFADDWSPSQPANPTTGTQRTALQFQPAPPRPLRENTASVRAAGHTDDFEPRGVQRAQFSNDDFSGTDPGNVEPPRFGAPRTSQLDAQGSGNTNNASGSDRKFNDKDGYAPPVSTTHGNDSSFSSGSRRYLPPTDYDATSGGPTSGNPASGRPPITAPSRATPATTPPTRTGIPPVVAPQRSLPPTGAPRQPPRSARDDFGANSNYGYGNTTSANPDDRTRTLETPRASVPTTPGYDDWYRQAQVSTPASTEGRGMIPPPPPSSLDDPIEKAASAAANTVERGARSVSNAIKNSAEHISEEGRRRGNSYFLTLLALFASVGLNLYLGWIAWDTYNRYQDLVADMRYAGPRRSSKSETDSSYGDSSVVEAAAY